MFCLPSVCSHPDKWALNMLQSLSVSQTNTFIVIADLFYDYVSTWFSVNAREHSFSLTHTHAHALIRVRFRKLNINQANDVAYKIIFTIQSDEKTNAKIQMKSNGKFVKDYDVLDNKSSKLLFHKYCCYICHFECAGCKAATRNRNVTAKYTPINAMYKSQRDKEGESSEQWTVTQC